MWIPTILLLLGTCLTPLMMRFDTLNLKSEFQQYRPMDRVPVAKLSHFEEFYIGQKYDNSIKMVQWDMR